MKSFDEFGVEKQKQLETHDGEYIEHEKSRLNRCIVGRTKTRILRCDKRASP